MRMIRTKPVKGAELREGDIVVKRNGNRIVETTRLGKRVPIFDGNMSSGRACNGAHFTTGDSDANVVCFDLCAWNEVEV